MRDPEAFAPRVREALEVVEVRPVRDLDDRPTWVPLPHLGADRLRDSDDRVGATGDETGDGVLRLLLHADGAALGTPVRVRHDRVTQVGHPRDAGRPLHGRADEVDGRRRRRGDDDVDPLPPHDPNRFGIAVRFQATLASGSSRRRPARLACRATLSAPPVPCSSSAGFRACGPTKRARWTIASGGSAASSSRWIHFGSVGASTCVSIPSAGRCVANLSGRCTPPPPAGGKYIATIRAFKGRTR